MKALGYLLIVAGFLVGAFFTVENAEVVPLDRYLVALGVGIVGIALVRIATHQASRQEDHLQANLQSLRQALARLAANAEGLDAQKGSIDVYDLRRKVDETFVGDLDTFIAARESLAVSYGLQAYAEVVNHVAAGERYLNRVWSASTDGYIDEAHAYITRAKEQLVEGLGLLEQLERRGAAALEGR